jgi:hypothetical protein
MVLIQIIVLVATARRVPVLRAIANILLANYHEPAAVAS